jgi:hypothetical protein
MRIRCNRTCGKQHNRLHVPQCRRSPDRRLCGIRFFVLHFPAVGFDVGLNGSGHSVGTGQNLVFTETGRRMTRNALQLLNHLTGRQSAAPSQRNHASDGFAL